MNAKSGRTLFAAGLITAALASGAIGQQDDKLGKVTFPTSCDPAVQAEFDRGVAMLHSYWFLIARRKFEEILTAGPHLRHGVLGRGDGSPRQHPCNYTDASRGAGGLGKQSKKRGLPGRRRSASAIGSRP